MPCYLTVKYRDGKEINHQFDTREIAESFKDKFEVVEDVEKVKIIGR